ncbi:MAG: hypothetical protein OSA99_19835 [Acidimicrobiales bacterium]|nr:hypothetical protein [Acidimicrobiales bacterium]
MGTLAARLVATLVLVQAFLAGRHLFGSWSIAVHGVNRTSAEPAVWHIPVGVAAFGLAVLLSNGRATGPTTRSTV